MMRSIFLLICTFLVGSNSALDDKPTSWEESMRKRDAELKGEFAAIDNKFKAMEALLSATENELKNTKRDLLDTKEGLEGTKKKLQAIGSEKEAPETYLNTNLEDTTDVETELERQERSLRSRGGSTFIRWGRSSCPDRTRIVYTGIASGKKHLNRGGGANLLCLTKVPVFDNVQSESSYNSEIYGQRYLHIGEITNTDIPCSMCHATQATTVMIPGTRTCPLGWAPQYLGHLVSSDESSYATEYTCLDASPEPFSNKNLAGSHGGLFIYVKADCNTLPCPPYGDSRVVTCVVCSM